MSLNSPDEVLGHLLFAIHHSVSPSPTSQHKTFILLSLLDEPVCIPPNRALLQSFFVGFIRLLGIDLKHHLISQGYLMINLCTCPRCLRTVTLPDGAQATASVRCPLCLAEYPLSEAVPPALIIVPKSERPASPAVASAPVSGLVTEPFLPPRPDHCTAGEGSGCSRRNSQGILHGGSRPMISRSISKSIAESESPPADQDESAKVQEAVRRTGEYSLVAAKTTPETRLEKNNVQK